MNNFESAGAPAPSQKKEEQKVSGMEGKCEKCGGEGSVRPGFLQAKRSCSACHGKGFIKKEPPVINKSYDWDKGVLH